MGGDFLINALVVGLCIGAFYAAVTVGITITFGFLDIANIAHPAFVIAGAYGAFLANQVMGMDPVVAAVIVAIPFFGLGMLLYEVYLHAFESRGREALSGLAFFFGIMFIIETGLVLGFGVDFRYVQASYVTKTFHAGNIDLPLRLLIPLGISAAMFAAIMTFFRLSFSGRAIIAVSQDPSALSLLAIDPHQIKRLAFGIAMATAGTAGALLILMQPVEPSIDREFIGRVFAICVLGGMSSISGTAVAAVLLGVIESLTSSYLGPAWAPAVSFSFLLGALALKPSGIFGR